MSHKLITANTTWAVTLLEARAHLDIDSDDTDDDSYIQGLIEAAQHFAEDYADLGLTEATWEYYLDKFPSGGIDLWKWPVSSIESVKYTDGDGDTQTVTDTNYGTDLVNKPARIEPIDSYSWPDVRNAPNSVQIQYKTGFTSPATIPGDLNQALLLLVADYWSNREDKGRRFNRVSERILNRYKYR